MTRTDNITNAGYENGSDRPAGYDEGLLKMMARNIRNLKRELAFGTRIDPSSIRDLEEQYRKLSAAIGIVA
jgi:hypothetical protein